MHNRQPVPHTPSLIRSAWLILATLTMAILSVFWVPIAAWAADASSYRSGEVTEYSTYAVGEMLSDSYYYADDWFLEDPSVQNDELALASMQLVAAAVDDDADGYGGAFLRDLGFERVGFVTSGDSAADACNYTWGTKTIQDNGETYTLVAIAVQSYSFDQSTKEKGWKQNFTVNGEGEGQMQGEHYAFATAADKVVDGIASLAGTGKTKYWMCGQSRGGALADLIAVRLQDMLGERNAGIYAYTFETPAHVDASSISGSDAYSNIHNYLCRDDIVTMIPVWGMTRYGVTHQLKTDETDAGIREELSLLGSAAAENEVPDAQDRALQIVAALEERIPTRADFSEAKTDTFTAPGGEAASVTYSYQNALVNLMGLIFGGQMDGLDVDALLDRVAELEPYARGLSQAVLAERSGQTAEAAALYWEAAQGVHALLDSLAPAGPVGLSDADLYAILKLAAPVGIDTSYEPSGDAAADAMGYLSPLIGIGLGAGDMTYSHHFDMVIARLKVLAPQPAMDDIDILISDPQAGDDATKAPGEVVSFIDGLGNSWLTAQAAWDESAQTLRDNQVHSLDVTLRVVGRSVPDSLSLTVNGESPVLGPTVTREGNAYLIRATWEYALGSPEELTLSFDAHGHGVAPQSMQLKAGTALKTVDAPPMDTVKESDGTTWRFDGWRDADGATWDSLKMTHDMTMYAAWVQVVDAIKLTFPIPAVGEAISAPMAPDDAPYYVTDYYVSDDDWETVESIEREGSYELRVSVKLKDPTTAEFALGLSEYDDIEYKGTITINGNEIEPLYDPEYQAIEGSISFDVPSQTTPDDPEQPETPTYRVARGNGQTWTKGSTAAATFVIKRSYDDAETFARFTGATMDGKSLEASSYTVEAGSLVLALKPAYLETLATGTHTLAVQFDDGEAKATLKVASAKQADGKTPSKGNKPAEKSSKNTRALPKTGDDTPQNLALVLASLGAALLAAGKMNRRDEA